MQEQRRAGWLPECRGLWIGLALAVVTVVGLPGPQAHADSGPSRFRVPVTADQPQRGPADAPITIVEFADFQCPFCKRVQPTLNELREKYGDRIRIVWRDNPLPFHKEAKLAAQAAREARRQGGDAKFWAMHDTLFDNQRALKRDDLVRYAGYVGLNLKAFGRALDRDRHRGPIERDQELAAKLGARGTPGFFINGRFLSGAQPLARFVEVIEDEIAITDKMLRDGVAPKKLYATLIKGGLEKADKPPAKARKRPDPEAVYKIPVGPAATWGPATAPVTIVEFADFQCPFSMRVQATLRQVRDRYGPKVRLVYRHNALPFHKDARLAAQASEEAHRQGRFWEYHDRLFDNQRALKRDDLARYAEELGLDMRAFHRALDAETHGGRVDADQKLTSSVGASGTPSFFINGRLLRGAQPFDAFVTMIDAELAKAEKKIADGVPRKRLYERIIEKGATAPQLIEGEGEAAAARPAADHVYELELARRAPSKGRRRAPVVIQVFSDFQCPFCQRVRPTLDKLMREHRRDVRLVWRHYPLPFHSEAFKAAEAAHEVFEQKGKKAFWRYHNLLFDNQRSLEREDLERYARRIGGIDMRRFRKALDTDKHRARVLEDMDAVKKAGARIGTPSFFINGRLLQGAQPYEAFEEAVERALKEAK